MDEAIVALMIEKKEAVDNLEEILFVERIDIWFNLVLVITL